MPKKIPQRGNASRDSNPVLAEKQRLKEAQSEILRKQQELEQVLKEAPAKIQKQRRRNRDFVRINVAASAAPTLPPGGLRDRFSDASDQNPRRRKPRRSERTMARVQFLILCLILFTIVVLIWRSIP